MTPVTRIDWSDLRAPTLLKGRTLIVGFDEATYAKVLG